MARARSDFIDRCVIYESTKDGCWIAHSLRTDEIGTGECVVEALVDLLRALDQIRELAKERPDVNIFRPAPKRIRQLAQTAKPLPKEIYEIAYKTVHGTWPNDFELAPRAFRTPPRRKYKTSIQGLKSTHKQKTRELSPA